MHTLDRINLLLALLVIGLALALWSTRHKGSQYPPLTDIDTAQVNELQLREGARLKWSLLRDAQGWTMTHPKIATADPGTVEQLLTLSATPSLQSWPATTSELAGFGLAEPQYQLLFDDRLVRFGDLSPTSRLRYVYHEGRVHLIGDGYLHHLLAAADRLLKP